ncbi:MAG: MBG domain-containing protein [Gammaproteobacteria bacterium]|nr:MBG domain-containing protein [Gammaproteobacteria bacterium]
MRHVLRNFLNAFCVLISLFFISNAYAENWQHPGVLLNRAQLDFIKQKVSEKAQPYYQQFLNAQASAYGSKNYTPKGPYTGGVIQCGPYSNPDLGCSAATSDSDAAYLQAVLWYITGDQTYANNAIKIMNAYSRNLKGFAGHTPGYPCPGASSQCTNGPLQAGWDSEKWPRAAEIIRYGNNGSAGWAQADITAFSAMLKNIYQPLIYKGSSGNGNWELTMIDAMMGIAVFNEDLPLLRYAQQMWKARIPAYFYNYNLDNPLYPGTHAPFPSGKTGNWNGQTVFKTHTSGVSQETCRDLGHTAYGISAAINAAETDYIQGGTLTANLYTASGAQERIINALNVNAGLELSGSTTAPKDFCTDVGGKIIPGKSSTYVMAYNHYHNRLKDPRMADQSGTTGVAGTSNTYQWIQKGVLTNKQSSGAHMTVFESLTHYANAPTENSIIITANNQTMAQGSSIPTLTYSINPSTTLTTNPTCTTTATSSSSKGTYPITCSGAAKSGYTFTYVPATLTITEVAPTTGTLQVSASSSSDSRCSKVSDTLYVDGSSSGTKFTVGNGVSTTLNTGDHTLTLASVSLPLPSGDTSLTGTCKSTLSSTQVTIQQNVKTPVTATYAYQDTSGMSCKITSAKVTMQSDWGQPTLVNQFVIAITVQGVSANATSLNGTIVMKDPFVQNFWGNFGMMSSSYTNATGKFTGSISGNTFTLEGFITNATPLSVGSNPLQSMTLNGVTCQ